MTAILPCQLTIVRVGMMDGETPVEPQQHMADHVAD